jgi:hypothetical protein
MTTWDFRVRVRVWNPKMTTDCCLRGDIPTLPSDGLAFHHCGQLFVSLLGLHRITMAMTTRRARVRYYA